MSSGSSRLEIQPIPKKEMEADIGALRSKDNRRRDYYEGESRSRVRSRSRMSKKLIEIDFDIVVVRIIFRFAISFTKRT